MTLVKFSIHLLSRVYLMKKEIETSIKIVLIIDCRCLRELTHLQT